MEKGGQVHAPSLLPLKEKLTTPIDQVLWGIKKVLSHGEWKSDCPNFQLHC
jgi:hypothetical protein